MKVATENDNKQGGAREGSSTTKKEGEIKVICAGLGRTGTYSLMEALQILGYKPYHYVSFKHTNEWVALARGEITSDAIIDTIVNDGYDAVLENPTCDIYQDMLLRYPNAKVILTVRDNPTKFEVSWKTLMDTMIITETQFSWKFPSFFQWIPLFRNLREIRYFMGTTHLGLRKGELTHGWRSKPDDDGWLGQQYEKHNDHVRSNVPANQLLVFNVKEGWGPLCQFLGCEIPHHHQASFPHSTTNDSKALKQLKRTFLFAVYGWIPLVAVASLGTAAAAVLVRNNKNKSR